MKILVDTNVILDFFLSREPQKEAVVKLFEKICQASAEAYTTANSITDIYYITAKRLGDYQARKVLRNLLNILGIISIDGCDCIKALDLPITDYEDALVVVCAKKENIEYIISNDRDFLSVEPKFAHVISPDDFIELY